MRRWVVLLVVVAGCTGADPEPVATRSAEPTAAATTEVASATPTETETEAEAECERVDPAVLDDIATRLLPGLSLGEAAEVRSGAHDDAWFIAAHVVEEVPRAVGVWAQTGPDRELQDIVAVDPDANRISEWADGRTASPAFSMTDEGARDAEGCVNEALFANAPAGGTPSASPSATPSPSASASPSASPRPTPTASTTPQPTPLPSPTATPAPTDTDGGEPDGDGDPSPPVQPTGDDGAAPTPDPSPSGDGDGDPSPTPDPPDPSPLPEPSPS